MPDGIIYKGAVHPVISPLNGRHIPVFAWSDKHGPRVPEFRPGDGYNKVRRNPIDLCVWHWTGGENEPDVMAETLRQRKLGVEFAVGRTGTIWQFCDPAQVDTADSGFVNSRSVGVEVVCYGFAAQWGAASRALKVPLVPKRGQDREVYDAKTHGKTLKTAKLYPVQMEACLALADAISGAIGIKRQLPPSDDGVFDGIVRFEGHCGHLHLTDEKRDPGPWFLGQMREHFSKAA